MVMGTDTFKHTQKIANAAKQQKTVFINALIYSSICSTLFENILSDSLKRKAFPLVLIVCI